VDETGKSIKAVELACLKKVVAVRSRWRSLTGLWALRPV